MLEQLCINIYVQRDFLQVSCELLGIAWNGNEIRFWMQGMMKLQTFQLCEPPAAERMWGIYSSGLFRISLLVDHTVVGTIWEVLGFFLSVGRM